MQASSIPTKFQVPFGADAGASYIRAIPVSQPTPGNGQASLDTGFPSECFVPSGAGGYAPDGRDFNGILNMVSAWCQWLAAGGPVTYDATFQTEIGGYPQGAVVQSATTQGTLWQSTVDDNSSNPDSGGAGWVLAGMPAGFIGPFGGSTAPAGWLLCYGQAVSRTSYAALFAAIGTAFGAGDGLTTFNVPDFRGRVPAGVDNMGGSPANRITSGGSGIAGTSLGASGGNQLMQTHAHDVTDPGHLHTVYPAVVGIPGQYTYGNGSQYINEETINTSTAQTGISIQNAGAGGSQNVQPTIIVSYIIKT